MEGGRGKQGGRADCLGQMKVLIKTVSKEEHVIELAPDALVGALRQEASQRLPADGQGGMMMLIYRGQILSDDSKRLDELGVADGATVVAMKGKTKTASVGGSQVAPPPSQPAAPTAASSSEGAAAITVSVTDEQGEIRSIEVEQDETVENVKAILELEFGVPLREQELLREGRPLANSMSLRQASVQNYDMLMLRRVRTSGGGSQRDMLQQILGSIDPLQRFRNEAQQLLAAVAQDPRLLSRVQENNRELGASLASGDVEQVTRSLAAIYKEKMDNERKKAAAIMRLNADPFDVEAQKEIEEAIRMENVNQNLEQAMEFNPEAFGRVVMLYVDCEVNGKPVKAFVDSGAQSTIMSKPCAQRLGLMRLIDYRYAGVAKGVGTSKIIGRVHAAGMKLGEMHITISITVLEDQSMEFLFGLDNLRRHQMCIDLKKNVLSCDACSVPFLGEGDIPRHLRIEDAGDVEMQDSNGGAAPVGGGGGGAPAPAPAPAPAAGEEFSEEAIQSLVDMGFTREQAKAALRGTNGNPELAASLLFGTD